MIRRTFAVFFFDGHDLQGRAPFLPRSFPVINQHVGRSYGAMLARAGHKKNSGIREPPAPASEMILHETGARASSAGRPDRTLAVPIGSLLSLIHGTAAVNVAVRSG